MEPPQSLLGAVGTCLIFAAILVACVWLGRP
jgi:hypothetical protein